MQIGSSEIIITDNFYSTLILVHYLIDFPLDVISTP